MPAFARAILIQESAEGVLSYKAKKHCQTDSAQTVDKALLLQGFAIVGTAFLI